MNLRVRSPNWTVSERLRSASSEEMLVGAAEIWIRDFFGSQFPAGGGAAEENCERSADGTHLQLSNLWWDVPHQTLTQKLHAVRPQQLWERTHLCRKTGQVTARAHSPQPPIQTWHREECTCTCTYQICQSTPRRWTSVRYPWAGSQRPSWPGSTRCVRYWPDGAKSPGTCTCTHNTQV